MIAHIEQLVELFTEGKGVDEAVLAGGTLAGHHGTDLCAGAAGRQAVCLQKGHQSLNIIVFDALNLHGQPGGHGDLAAAEPVGGVCDGPVLISGELAVPGNDTDIEYIRITLVLQTAKTLYPLDLVGAQRLVLDGITHGPPLLLWFLLQL